MRKMKKINGYLVVKFNDRELREWEGTALGKYGIIDAELYTGTLEVDRGAMEYDNADSMEEAVELARGLESELDTEEPEVKVTIIKETDEATEEESVDARQMIAGWESTLRGKVESPHYTDVDERTAAHELYGYNKVCNLLHHALSSFFMLLRCSSSARRFCTRARSTLSSACWNCRW